MSETALQNYLQRKNLSDKDKLRQLTASGKLPVIRMADGTEYFLQPDGSRVKCRQDRGGKTARRQRIKEERERRIA